MILAENITGLKNIINAKNQAIDENIIILTHGKPQNWHPSRFDDRTTFTEQLATIGQILNTNEFYCPSPVEMNGVIVLPQQLTTSVTHGQITLHRGCNADGVVLSKGQSFFIASADCHTIVVYNHAKQQVIPAHAGRDCVLDQQLIQTGRPGRKHFSVVDSIMKYINPSDYAELNIGIYCGIGPENFAHPVTDKNYGAKNKKLIAYISRNYGELSLWNEPTMGRLNMVEIIMQQFSAYGIEPEQITHDMVDTFADSIDTSYQWWSCRRGDWQRNGIFISYT